LRDNLPPISNLGELRIPHHYHCEQSEAISHNFGKKQLISPILYKFTFILTMNKITISKNEYIKLQKQAESYRKLAGRVFEFMIKDSPKEVVEDFRKTDLYTTGFLKDLGDGLEKSSYGKK